MDLIKYIVTNKNVCNIENLLKEHAINGQDDKVNASQSFYDETSSINEIDVALHIICMYQNNYAVEICKLLIKYDANVNSVYKYNTPLQRTAYYGNPNVAKVLLAHGADPFKTVTISDEIFKFHDKTAAEIAEIQGYDSFAKSLGSQQTISDDIINDVLFQQQQYQNNLQLKLNLKDK